MRSALGLFDGAVYELLKLGQLCHQLTDLGRVRRLSGAVSAERRDHRSGRDERLIERRRRGAPLVPRKRGTQLHELIVARVAGHYAADLEIPSYELQCGA